MYILKNAFRNVYRNKGRTILTAIIIIAIAFSSCVALSIRQAAQTAREDVLEGLSITAQISLDRTAMMKQKSSDDADSGSESSDNKENFAKKMGASSLSVEEMQTYAGAESVKDFYYTLTSSVNGSGIEAVQSSSSLKNRQSTADSSTGSDETADKKQSATTDAAQSTGSETGGPGGMGGGPGGMGGGPSMGTQGDFTLIGYSSDSAMTAFADGTSKITSGQVFQENTSEPECIISTELAEYNSLAVGDTITVTNPNDETETYTLKIVGIYENSTSGVQEGGNIGFSTSSDPANQILMSYTALKAITDTSAKSATTTTNDFGLEQSSALNAHVSGTYVFETVEDYEAFEDQARALGLSEDYTVSSRDLEQYEKSLTPLETLSKIAGYFLIVILAIGAVIIVVLNVLAARERKYEIGVLTAVGMKRKKVAAQFISEILIVTLMSVVIGGAAGALSSVPITNALLASQITATQEASESREQNFGRPSDMGAPPEMQQNTDDKSSATDEAQADSGTASDNAADNSQKAQSDQKGEKSSRRASYISSVSSAVNLKVLAELLGITVLLAAAGAAVALIAIMRYEPLKILSGRD